MPEWNSCTVIEKLGKPSLLTVLKRKEKRTSYVIYLFFCFS